MRYWCGCRRVPAVDEMLTMEPPPALRICGIASLVPRNTPLAFMANTWSHCSEEVSATFPPRQMAALFTRTSSLP